VTDRLAQALDAETVEVAELRDALQRAQRAAARNKASREEIVAAIYAAAKDAALAQAPLKAIPKPKVDKRTKRPEVALVHATDWQLGKVTDNYSPDICRQRVMSLAEKVHQLTEIQRADHPVTTCTLMLGGDMVEGVTVYPGQAWEVGPHLFEQLFSCSALIVDLVRHLLVGFDEVNVVCEWGNHGRIGRRGDVPASDNVDRMAYEIARQRLDGERITWQASSDWHQIVHVGNYRALLVHGDEIKSFGGNTPAFGILRKVTAWSSGVVQPFHDAYLGHYHSPAALTMPNGGNIFVTGSPESENAYAAEFVAARGTPSQRLHFVDPDKGRVTGQYVVWLDE